MEEDARRAPRRFAPVVFAALFALAWGASPCRAAGSAVWVIPPADTLTSESSLLVKGFLKAKPAGPLTLTVKHLETGRTETVPVKITLERFFSATVPLAAGQNDLILENSVLSILSRPGSTAPAEGKFARVSLHAAAVKEC